MVKRYFLEVSFLKGKISEIIQKTASVLYKRGLSMFDAEMQQHLLSMCALGKISELYENDELRQKAENCFLKGWFHSEKTDAIEKNLLSVENIKTELKSHEYLIFIFYGIGMKNKNLPMKIFGEKLDELIHQKNKDNKAYIYHIAAYDDTSDDNTLNDSLISDALSVVLRAYMPYNSKINEFKGAVKSACKKHPLAKLILIGYSGGGVVAKKIGKLLAQDSLCKPYKIITIGSPELKASENISENTLNIIIPGDPVPLISLMKETDSTKFTNHFLLNIKYPSVNPIDVHSLYFSPESDENGIKNYEKTALACINYIE